MELQSNFVSTKRTNSTDKSLVQGSCRVSQSATASKMFDPSSKESKYFWKRISLTRGGKCFSKKSLMLHVQMKCFQRSHSCCTTKSCRRANFSTCRPVNFSCRPANFNTCCPVNFNTYDLQRFFTSQFSAAKFIWGALRRVTALWFNWHAMRSPAVVVDFLRIQVQHGIHHCRPYQRLAERWGC